MGPSMVQIAIGGAKGCAGMEYWDGVAVIRKVGAGVKAGSMPVPLVRMQIRTVGAFPKQSCRTRLGAAALRLVPKRTV